MGHATPEQDRAKQIRSGLNLVVANAGTGKTHTLAELAVALVRHELTLRGLSDPAAVPPEVLRDIVEQIMAVTFTRDASAELNERIHRFLKEAGFPEPLDRYGRPSIICRTLDSYVQRWYRLGAVFRAWMSLDKDFNFAIARACKLLTVETQVALKATTKKKSNEHAFFATWGWLVGDQVADMVLDCIIRDQDRLEWNPAMPPLKQWEAKLDEFLVALPAPSADFAQRREWSAGFWKPMLQAHQDFQKQFYDLRDEYRAGLLALKPDAKALIERLHLWERVQSTKREFGSVYELARARGYHPTRNKQRMLGINVMRELAASDYVHSFDYFHDIATRFYSSKVRLLWLDHTDFLNYFVEAIELADRRRAEGDTSVVDLLERNKEYPKLGLRTKYSLFDEKQDDNAFQSRILELWHPNTGIEFCMVAVGDPKQAIYGFKGASSYGFSSLIERVKKHAPESLFTLTCSFRSLTKIVDFGNQVVQVLPHYKDTVHPSTTIYAEPGEIIVLPPIPTEFEETELVSQHIRRILTTTQDSIMILHRTNLNSHPIMAIVKDLNTDRIRCMTIHRSKGLQADHVFVLGLTAGRLPDIRGSYTQEVNLFYVAVTRPRKALYLSAPYARTTVERERGTLKSKDVGPSVFFARLPVLRDLADRAGWTSNLITMGESTTKDAVQQHLARTNAREVFLKMWWKKHYPNIPLVEDDDDAPRNETGGVPVPAEVKALPKVRSIWSDGNVESFATAPFRFGRLDDEGKAQLHARTKAKLVAAFQKNGQVPRNLPPPEYGMAMRENWIFKGPNGTQFTSPFTQIALGKQASAATP